MSRTPAALTTARTEPPATTPVPCDAGRSTTVVAPKSWRTSCGIVVPKRGTRMSFFFASSTPLRMASGTSPALPRPMPTWPLPSPTTTTALKLKRRPPLTTLATRLMRTTRSSSCSLFGSMRGTRDSSGSELEAGLAGRFGERLHATVVPVAGPIEDALPAPRFTGTAPDEPADGAGALRLGLRLSRAELLLDGGCSGEGATSRIVDDLRVDVPGAAEDGQARARAGPGHGGPGPRRGGGWGGGRCGTSPLTDIRQDLADELGLAGLHAGHDPSTRAHDDQPEAAEDARDLGLAGVHAEPRLADPLPAGGDRGPAAAGTWGGG